MKLATIRTDEGVTSAAVVHGERFVTLPYPSLLELLRDPDWQSKARETLSPTQLGEAYIPIATGGFPAVPPELPVTVEALHAIAGREYLATEVSLLAPLPEPPSMRDFYAFEQHVKSGRSKRGLDMIPEWYEIPTFYFTNTSEIYGYEQDVPYPVGSNELDIELEIACVIGRAGKDIPVEEAASYIAGYTIMNDWSARDFQRKDMKLSLGPGKGKDFATSLGPWLVTPDELATRRTGEGASERYDMTMLASVNGQEISRGNFNQIYYSFPQMIAWASRNARLRPGDVLGSGTVGTGCLLELGTEVHPWFQRGDVIELEIEGIGILRNKIV